jgi:anti-sigma factor RsiW
MRHLSEEDLVLHRYGEDESVERAAVEAHLDACETCRAEFKALTRTLAAVDVAEVPARGEGYEREVWVRLEPRLAEPRRAAWREIFTVRRLVLAGGVAVLLVAAFAAGRFWPHQAPASVPLEASRQQVRERILLVAVGDHLERSAMVLAELVNADPDGRVDISAEQQRARDLVDENRLYRQTAATAGEPAMASVLDDLERVLLEIAHSPSTLSSSEFEEIRHRIEGQGLVFKIRVLGTRVRQRETASVRPGAARS